MANFFVMDFQPVLALAEFARNSEYLHLVVLVPFFKVYSVTRMFMRCNFVVAVSLNPWTLKLKINKQAQVLMLCDSF